MDFDLTDSASDSAGDAELNDMLDLIGHKCSICFTADSQTELAQCGDQFCYECLEAYLAHLHFSSHSTDIGKERSKRVFGG
jgi:hypothetical protein